MTTKKGYFGDYGGCFAPETLIAPLAELENFNLALNLLFVLVRIIITPLACRAVILVNGHFLVSAVARPMAVEA